MRLPFQPGIFVLILFLTGLGMCSSGTPVSNSQSVRYEFPHFGLYRIHGQAPKGFKTLYEFELKLSPGQNPSSVEVDEKGKLPIDGAVFIRPSEFRSGTATERQGELSASGKAFFVDVVKLKFTSAGLQLDGNRFAKISFMTETVDGTSYAFEGRFLERAKLENGGYVQLVGNMRKLKVGRKEEEASLKFLRWAYE
jgi:hypothetical protein